MPNQPKTPVRSIRLDDPTWDQVEAEAKRTGQSKSDVIRVALDEHFATQRQSASS